MQTPENSIIPHCNFLDCDIDAKLFNTNQYWDYCDYHQDGGMFGTGESYEQYQVIEQDFIDFIKVVPLVEEHFNVHSPLLRDIIIRTCVQVEIFFKEWGKETCTKSPNCSLWEKYNEKNKSNLPKGARNWNIQDYYFFREEFSSYNPIHVMPLNQNILPFEKWTKEKNSLSWWKVYNDIKHGGNLMKKNATLEVALFALAGLFSMHCENYNSKKYLASFNFSIVTIDGFKKVIAKSRDITTPLDSKKYLFKAINSISSTEAHLMTVDHVRKNRGII